MTAPSVVVLSTTEHPTAEQRALLGVAAGERTVAWLAFTRDVLHPMGWRPQHEPRGRPVGVSSSTAPVTMRRRVRSLAGRASRVAARTVRRLPAGAQEELRRQARRLPPATQDRLRRVVYRGGTRRVPPVVRLANALQKGPFAVDGYPELLVAADRAAAAAAWYVVTRHPEVTAVQGVEAALRYLDLAAEVGAPGLAWADLVGEGDEHAVLAALPVVDHRPPCVLVAGERAEDLARVASDLQWPGVDVVTVRGGGVGPYLELGPSSVAVTPATDATLAVRVDELVAELRPDLVLDAATTTARAAADAVAGTLGEPPARPGTSGRPHLLVAPSNYAGQSHAWTRAAEEFLPGAVARNLHVTKADAPFAFPADFPLTTRDWERPAVRARLAVEAVLPASHVLLESMRPIVGCADPEARDAWDFGLGRSDVDALRRSGRQVALLFHGSEVRRPAAHALRYPASPFADPAHAEATARLVAATDRVHSLLADYEGRVFVSTPDLLDDLPHATWLPVVVGRDAFRPGPPVLERARPVVVHAPSSPLLKGSSLIDRVLGELAREGVLEYRRLDGVPSAFVGDFLREADVVVDQVVLGNPGVLAAEAMAAGRLVIAHLSAAVRERFPGEIPVVEATPDLLEDVLRAVCADRAGFRSVAAAGPAFAAAVHSGERSAQVLADFLAS